MIRFELPSLGADMDEGTLLEWKVAPGDEVSRGQVIAVVDTSKAAVDIEIWHPGVIAELLVEPGEKIPVGTPMATVLEPGEEAPAPARPKKKGRAGARAEAAAKGAGKTATTKVPKQSAKETAKETAKGTAKEDLRRRSRSRPRSPRRSRPPRRRPRRRAGRCRRRCRRRCPARVPYSRRRAIRYRLRHAGAAANSGWTSRRSAAAAPAGR